MWLWIAGVDRYRMRSAYKEQAMERASPRRFRTASIEDATTHQGDLSAPIVVFCVNSERFTGYNLALRLSGSVTCRSTGIAAEWKHGR